MKHCSVILVLAFAILPSIGTLRAQDKTEQVDQQNWFPQEIKSGAGIHTHVFTPTLDILDSVQVWHPGLGFFNPAGYIDGVGRVEIRDGVNGPILALSDPTYIDREYEGVVGFGFSEPVHLTPGRVYVVEPVRVSGDGAVFAASDKGLLFREGVGLEIIPEPTSSLLLPLGLGAVFGTRAIRGRTPLRRSNVSLRQACVNDRTRPV
jgi:hypothetical protein